MAKKLSHVTDRDPAPEALIPRPRVEVLERGLQNVFGLPSARIDLKDPELETHWCNSAIPNQLRKYADAGYLKVRPEMLKDADQVSHVVSPDGYVTTGQRGEEILMYTLKTHITRRQREKVRVNMERMHDLSRQKTEMVEAAATKLGAEAADYLNDRVGPTGTVRDDYERIERSDPVE